MAEATESVAGEAGVGHERAHFSENIDSAIVLLLLIVLFVYGFGAVGRYVGNRLGAPGVTGFFGG